MKFIIAWIFGLPLVYIKQYDGEVNLRFARKMGSFGWRCDAILSGRKEVMLLIDGRTSGKIYVNDWTPANHAAKDQIPYFPRN